MCENFIHRSTAFRTFDRSIYLIRRIYHTILPQKNGESDSESDDEGDEAEDEEEEGNIAEILMAQAAKDMDEKKMKDLFDAQLKKKLILKKKSDKEYEAYWSKQKGKECSDCVLFMATLFI